MIKFWDYKIFYKENKKEIFNLLDKTLLSGKLILGNEVEKFEKNFSKYIGVKYAVAVGNCTDAIFIALKVLNLKRGSEVITVSNTAVPTIAAINGISANINKVTAAVVMVIEKIKPVNAVAKKIPPKIDEIPIRRKFL